MINNRIVFISGPLKSGKSTLGKMLSEKMPDSLFLEGDSLVSKDDLSFQQWTVATVMTVTLRGCELAHEGKLAIVAYPLRDLDWKVIIGLCIHAGVKPICITLAPDQKIALTKRADRELEDWEKKRIQEMYSEGYHQRSFSSLVLDNGSESPQVTCEKILQFLA